MILQFSVHQGPVVAFKSRKPSIQVLIKKTKQF